MYELNYFTKHETIVCPSDPIINDFNIEKSYFCEVLLL